MNIRISLYLILTSILILISCENNSRYIKGNNRIVTETRSIGEFTGVISYGSFDVFIIEDANFSLQVEADENLLDFIDSYIQGGKLILDTRNDVNLRSRHSIKVIIEMPILQSVKLVGSGDIFCESNNAEEFVIELLGSGNIECSDIFADYIDVQIMGSGDIDLNGNSEITYLRISGSGNIRALNLEIVKCYADISGSGNVYVWVEEQLDVKINGSGNLYYKGNPEITSNITGSGRIHKY